MLPGPDGFHHPGDEGELVALVKAAYREGRQLRVRGAAHSVAHVTYTDPLPEAPNRVDQQSPPPGDNVNMMLDRYRGWRVKDKQRKLVEADAGVHLGADPSDPTGGATLETSLVYQPWEGQELDALRHGRDYAPDRERLYRDRIIRWVGAVLGGREPVWGFRVIDGTRKR